MIQAESIQPSVAAGERRLVERLSNMNRGLFFLAVVVFFLCVGILFGVITTILLGIFMSSDNYKNDYLMISIFVPPIVGMVAGIIVGSIAAAFYKPFPTNPHQTPEKATKPPVGHF